MSRVTNFFKNDYVTYFQNMSLKLSEITTWEIKGSHFILLQIKSFFVKIHDF